MGLDGSRLRHLLVTHGWRAGWSRNSNIVSEAMMTLLPRLQQHDNQYAPEVLDGVGTIGALKITYTISWLLIIIIVSCLESSC